jgi:hemerythrin-like domain-containing protein
MTSTHDPFAELEALAARDGFDVLDATHRQTMLELGKLAALLSHLDSGGPDEVARAMAREIVGFFSTTARQHHQDEEKHVFPALAGSGDPDIVQAVARLRQDHGWLEEDWVELEPQLDAIASGQSWPDAATLREGAEIFVALSLDHVALEETFIYPEARSRLAAGERREMGREMSARRRQAAKSAHGQGDAR